MNNVFLFKLSSGEDIVGEVVEQTNDSYILKNVVQVLVIPQENGSVGVQMLPFPMIGEESEQIDVMKVNIVVKSNPSQGFMSSYNEKFGRIQIASVQQTQNMLFS